MKRWKSFQPSHVALIKMFTEKSEKIKKDRVCIPRFRIHKNYEKEIYYILSRYIPHIIPLIYTVHESMIVYL